MDNTVEETKASICEDLSVIFDEVIGGVDPDDLALVRRC